MALTVLVGKHLKARAARLYGVSPKIASHWVERLRAAGRDGMRIAPDPNEPTAIRSAFERTYRGASTSALDQRGDEGASVQSSNRARSASLTGKIPACRAPRKRFQSKPALCGHPFGPSRRRPSEPRWQA